MARGGMGWRGVRVAWARARLLLHISARAGTACTCCRVHELACAWRVAGACGARPSAGRRRCLRAATRRRGRASHPRPCSGLALGLGLGLGNRGSRVEGGTQGKGHLVHSGGSSDGPTEAEPRWRSSREGEPDPATLVGLEKPCVWAEGEPAADLSFVGLGLGLRRLRCGEPARWGEPAFLLPGDGLRCFDEVDEGKRSAGDVPGPPGTSLRARTDGPAPTTSGTLSSTSTRR